MSQESWDEVKRKLDAEIDVFAKSEVKFSTEAPRQTAASQSLQPVTPAPVRPVTSPPIKPAPTTPPELTQSGVQGGLLARLKQQAAEKLADGERSANVQASRVKNVNEALHSTYVYLRDLCEQLNVIAPAWPNTFYLNETLSFVNLRWSEGRADYRKQPGATDDRPFERVSLRFRLSSDTEIVVEREIPHLDKLRQLLVDAGINFQLDEFRNAKGYVERGRFTIKPELRAGLLFVGDFNSGDIRLKVLNLPRLGSAEYLIPTAQLTPDALEEIALLVVGESPKFFKNFERLL